MAEIELLTPTDVPTYSSPNKIDESDFRERFNDILREVDPALVKKMKGLSLDLIMLGVYLVTTRMSVIDKKINSEFKRIAQKEMNNVVEKKIETYNKMLGLFLSSTECCAEVANILAGGGLVKAIAAGTAIGARAANSQVEKVLQSEHTAYDHMVKQYDEQVNRYSTGKQDAQQTRDEIARIIDRYFDLVHEAFRSLTN